MKTVCTKDNCTGCMACVESCPQNAIIVRKLYPKQSAKQIVKMLLIKAKIMGV